MWNDLWTGRGTPDEFDPGPPDALAILFAQTPHYRAIGEAFGKAKFRWHFGPMFYRGRTAPHTARVLIVGQEGAQDESLSHRSFTGGTGARLQHMLRHIGIDRSYLFLNTFVYPINGQYTGGFPKLAQHLNSPIAQHRQQIFDLVHATQDIDLVIAVGRAAKESVATWVAAHDGTADPNALHNATGHDLGSRIRFVGVPHPGGASNGGSVAQIKQGFIDALNHIGGWSTGNWLPVDPGATRSAPGSYTYSSAPIPFRDFPFGTTWRLGRGGTSSNRRDNQESIQLFSAAGKYNNKGTTVSYSISGGSNAGYAADPDDVAVEPPRTDFAQFDRGPGTFSALLAGREPGLDWPDFNTLGMLAHRSFGFGPVYRGRLDQARVVVLADQASHDDLFLGRALCGETGEFLTGWLRAAGLTKSYAVLRTLPVDMLSSPAAAVKAAADHPAVHAILRTALARIGPAAVVAIGPNAARIAAGVSPAGTTVVTMPEWANTPARKAQWNTALNQLTTVNYTRDKPTALWDQLPGQIPRIDLPYGTLRWQGTGGNRAAMATTNGQPNPNYYQCKLPAWVANLKPSDNPMTLTETAAVNSIPR